MLFTDLRRPGGHRARREVAYVDGDQIQVATLDGEQKRSLSGPAPDEKQWREVAQADNGTILGVRRDGTKMGTFNATQLWGPDGATIGYGALTAPTGRIELTVRVATAGKVVAIGEVGGRTVAKAKRPGTVTLRLKATRPYRERLATLEGKRLVIKVTAGGRTATVTRKLD